MDSDFSELIERARQGEEEAALEIWNAYYSRLVSYARGKLRGMPRRAADEEDVALSAMNSFLGAAREGKLAPKNNSELWRLLATITVRKATAQLRRHHAEKRGAGNVRGDSAFDAAQVPRPEAATESLDEMSPFLGVACQELLAQLKDDDMRQIALLRLASHTNDEIADQLGCSVATVKRRVAEIRQTWSEQ